MLRVFLPLFNLSLSNQVVHDVDNDSKDGDSAGKLTKGVPICYKTKFRGAKTATAVVWNFAANDFCYTVEDGIMLMNVPSFEFSEPRKLSQVTAPTNQGRPCPGFNIKEIDGSPNIPCPYGIIRMDTSNSKWNVKQWLKCRGCTKLQNSTRPTGFNAIYNDRVR